MTQAQPVLLSLPLERASALADALAAGIDELEVISTEWDESPELTRRLWHVHGQLSGVWDTLAEWLAPLFDAGSVEDAPRNDG